MGYSIKIPITAAQRQAAAFNSALQAETTNRANADSNLQAQINNLSNYDDATVRNLISAETSNRTNADSQLQSQINSETQNRTNADNELREELTVIENKIDNLADWLNTVTFNIRDDIATLKSDLLAQVQGLRELVIQYGCKYQGGGSPSTEPSQTDTTTEPSQTETSTEPSQTDTTTEPSQTETSTEPSQTDTTTEPSQTDTTTEPSQTDTGVEVPVPRLVPEYQNLKTMINDLLDPKYFFVRNSQNLTYSIEGFNSDVMTVSADGNLISFSGTNVVYHAERVSEWGALFKNHAPKNYADAGNFITFTLTDDSKHWENTAANIRAVNAVLKANTVTIPQNLSSVVAQDIYITYDGNNHSWKDAFSTYKPHSTTFNESSPASTGIGIISVGGDSSVIDAGDYSVTLTPQNFATWYDGTFAPKTLNFTVEQAYGTVSITDSVTGITYSDIQDNGIVLEPGETSRTFKINSNNIACLETDTLVYEETHWCDFDSDAGTVTVHLPTESPDGDPLDGRDFRFHIYIRGNNNYTPAEMLFSVTYHDPI